MFSLNIGFIWITFAILFFFLEILTIGLISIWFFVAAFAAYILYLLNFSIWIQIFGFFVISCFMLIMLYPWSKKYFKTSETNLDTLIGKKCIVTKDINNLYSSGTVFVNGITWAAKSHDNQIIKKNSIVIIQKIEGGQLIVKKENY